MWTVKPIFYIGKHGTLVAAAGIKSSPTPARTDCGGLRALKQEYPEVPCFVACTCDQPYRIGDVEVVSWTSFLARVGQVI